MTAHITYHHDLEQRSPEWFELRCGMVTASVIGSLVTVEAPDPLAVFCTGCGAHPGLPCLSANRKTPTPMKGFHYCRTADAADEPPTYGIATGDTARAVTLLLAAERINGFSDDTYESFDMLRGRMDEPLARDLYSKTYEPVTECGFIVRDDWGFSIGYSPDGLVGDDGLIEVKSRRPKIQMRTILADEVPAENMAQIQTGLLASNRAWCDYISYCGGMPMWRKRVYPDPAWQAAIIAATAATEQTIAEMVANYKQAVEGLPATERINYNLEIE
ncbi:YqaJ-like recombinase protein [Propionicimonas paludicola]|uniref:YqaJ-like recombinase protein n=1 Tax=Propionicimonas paludicola TaxID=185243 RepID=A0A2A9CUJ3_9ACTN|nr:YqaJ viral recombinase family protein [Propionicimonas paludicola]PFG17229.1 YqaJ-like recombinase protein [Propionicimonas paludicola]